MQLSKNFTLEEYIHSDTADELKIDNSLPEDRKDEFIQNATALCVNVLQKIRDEINMPMKIISGYRSVELNNEVGGVKDKSQHLICEAADTTVTGMSIEEYYKKIKDMARDGKIIVDQVIYEKRKSEWVHISFTRHKPNRFDFFQATPAGKVWIYLRDSYK